MNDHKINDMRSICKTDWLENSQKILQALMTCQTYYHKWSMIKQCILHVDLYPVAHVQQISGTIEQRRGFEYELKQSTGMF